MHSTPQLQPAQSAGMQPPDSSSLAASVGSAGGKDPCPVVGLLSLNAWAEAMREQYLRDLDALAPDEACFFCGMAEVIRKRAEGDAA